MLSRRVHLAASARRALTKSFAHGSRALAARAFASAAVEASRAESIVFRSPHAPVHVPDGTIWDIAQEQARANGDRNAFICGVTQQNVTFEELYAGAKRLAVALAEDGVRKGDVSVAVLCGWRLCEATGTKRADTDIVVFSMHTGGDPALIQLRGVPDGGVGYVGIL